VNTKLILILFVLGYCGCIRAEQLLVREGDIIFQSMPSRQSRALELATGSVYTHVGLVMKEDEGWVVYEAVQPVKITPLSKWISRGTKKHFVLKRLKESELKLNSDVLGRMRLLLGKYLGKNYDGRFLWSDDEIYCSELVWKVYRSGVGIELAAMKKYRDFDLSSQEARTLLAERFSGSVPLDEPVMPPSVLFDSPLLIEVTRGGGTFP